MPSDLTLLFLGDVIGRVGRHMLKQYLPSLVETIRADLTIVNIENISGGKGPNLSVMEEIEDLPVEVFTTGSHFFDNREFSSNWTRFPRVIRPANYPDGNPGKGVVVAETTGGHSIVVMQFQGRTFMPPIDCPFRAADALLKEYESRTPVIVDFHAEATSEKNALGHYLDGRVAAVIGTHTHIPTADEKILPGGTAYITDTGMVGAYDSVIGFKKDVIVDRFLHQSPRRFEPSRSDPRMSVTILRLKSDGQQAVGIRRITITSEEDITRLK